MNKDKTYTYKDLIHAYVDANYTEFRHSEFKEYYQGLLAALEKVFGLKVSGEGLTGAKLSFWNEFQAVAKSYAIINRCFDTFRHGSWYNHDLWEVYMSGDRTLDRIGELTKNLEESLRSHYAVLESLFSLIYVKFDAKSDELRAIGFDDEGVLLNFLQSWDDTEHLFKYRFGRGPINWTSHQPTLDLIATLRQKGYAKKLRAGQSFGRFVISRSKKHGLRAGQNHIIIVCAEDSMEVQFHGADGESTSHTFDQVALTPELEALIERLLTNPID